MEGEENQHTLCKGGRRGGAWRGREYLTHRVNGTKRVTWCPHVIFTTGGVMKRISEEDDICFKRLPLHLHNYKTGPRVYTSTCVFHQYGRSRVDEKRMLLSLMASTHGKHHRAGWEGKSGLELQVNLRITQVRGASDGLVVFSDDGEHPQNLKIWKKDTVYNAAQINVLPSCLSTVHLKCSASANLREINLLSGGIKAKDPI